MALMSSIKRGITNAVRKSLQTIFYNVFEFGRLGGLKGNKGKYMKGQATSEAYMDELYVFGCVWLISNTIAALPLRIYKDDTKKEEMPNHPAYKLFAEPNFMDSMYDIKESVSANLELDGNAFLKLPEEGKPDWMFSLVANYVNIVPTDKKDKIGSLDELIKGYEYGEARGNKMFKPSQIIFERKFNISGETRGLSPIRAGALALDSTQEAKRQNYNMLKQGMTSGPVLETDNDLAKEDHDRLRQDYVEKNAGTENAHLPLVLWNGLKYKNAGMTPKDFEFIQALKMNREELCGFLYQVPLILLGILENSSYNNIKEAQKIFYTFSIVPRLVKNRELYQKLINRFNAGGYVDFDLSGVECLQEDQRDRIEKASKLWGMGVSMKILNDMYHLGIQEYDGWDTGYIPFSVLPINQENPKEPEGGDGGEEPTEEEGKSKVKKIHFKWTEEKKTAKWKNFERITYKYERKYKPTLNGYFKVQEKEVLENLEQYKSIRARRLQENTFVMLGEDQETGQLKAINIEAVLFDDDEQIKKLRKLSLPIHKSTLVETAQAEYDLLDLDIAFDVDNPRVKAWLERNALRKAKLVTKAAKDTVKQAIIDGVNEGESIDQIQERIREAYKPYKELTGYEAERIARTEVVGASNEGSLESYRQAGIEKKAWLATRDGRTRPSHAHAEDKYKDGISVKENFKVGAGSGPCPGQLGAPEEDINCRCALLPIVEE